MRTLQVPIQGMHCKSCEILVEDELLSVQGVKRVSVNQKRGLATIHYKGRLDLDTVSRAITRAGYSMTTCEIPGKQVSSLPWFSNNFSDYAYFIFTVLIFLMIYFLLRLTSVDKLLAFGSNNFSSLPVVFLVGLTAGISTCMALVGGLVLGVASRFSNINPNASTIERFKPHLFFNIGRILSFFVFGAVFGLIGSAFQMSTTVTGTFTILAGIAMLFMGIQLTQISPRLSQYSFTLPKGVSRLLGINEAKNAEYSNKNAALLGGMTFFLPCGFTQAVQLYAISTGNPITAALTLGTFALGTAPGLLGIGGFTAALRGAAGSFLYRLTGVVVVGLAIFNISNGLNLTGFKNLQVSVATDGSTVQAKNQPAVGTNTLGADSETTEIKNNNTKPLVLTSTYTVSGDMQPSDFKVKVGQPVRLEVKALEDGVGCMGSLYIAGLMKRPEMFIKGKTSVIEFTPTKKAQYTVACAMGVPRGTITVE